MWTDQLGNGVTAEVNESNGNLLVDVPLDSLSPRRGRSTCTYARRRGTARRDVKERTAQQLSLLGRDRCRLRPDSLHSRAR